VFAVVGRIGVGYVVEEFFEFVNVGLGERKTEGEDGRRVMLASYHPT